jgi:serine/threonine protein kinase
MSVDQSEHSDQVAGAAPDGPDGWEGFEAGLVDAGVLEPGSVAAFLEQLAPAEKPEDLVALARGLVLSGRLTRYQAAEAIQSRSRDLVVGEYLILDKLGAGGMGTVYRARHRRGRIVALKVLDPLLTRGTKAIPRLKREARAAAQLNHPNLITALDVDEADGLHFFVMEFVEGADLARLVRAKGPLPIDRAVDYMLQAAKGLRVAHEKGIVHRDIKPANLLLDESGSIKVLDLGLARVDDDFDPDADECDGGLTRPGGVLGTVDYMSPEQAMDSRHVDARTDIYSLGCTLYFILAGKPPYRGGTALERLLRHRKARIPSLREERPEVPPELDAILSRTLAKAPNDRYGSMDELIAALQACPTAPVAPTKSLIAFRDGAAVPDPPSTIGQAAAPLTHRSGGESLDQPTLRLSLAQADFPALKSASAARSRMRRRLGLWTAAGVATLAVAGLVAHYGIGVGNGQPATGAPPRTIVVANPGRDLPQPIPIAPPPIEPKKPRKKAQETRIGPVAVAPQPIRVETPAPKPPDIDPKPPAIRLRPEPFGESRLFVGHTKPKVNALAVSADGRRAVSGGDDGCVCVWDTTMGSPTAVLTGHDGPVLAVAIDADGHRALSGGKDGLVIVWDLAAGQEICRLTGHHGPVHAVSFAPEDRAISGGEDKTARVWSIEDKREVFTAFGDHQGAVRAVAVEGRRAVSAGDDKTVRLWPLEPPRSLTRFYKDKDLKGAIVTVAIAPDGHSVLLGSDSGEVRLWDSRDKRSRAVWTFRKGDDAITSVAFSPDGRRALAATRSSGLIVLDAVTGRERHRYPGPFAFDAVGAAREGTGFLTAHDDGSIRLWELPPRLPEAETGQALTIEGKYPAIFEADGVELKAWELRMKRTGFQATHVNGHERSGVPRFAALAVPARPGARWEIRIDHGQAELNRTIEEMQARLKLNAADTFVPTSLSGYSIGSSFGLITLWVHAKSLAIAGNYHLARNQPWEVMLRKPIDEKGKDIPGIRLSILSAYSEGTTQLFAGLWTPDDGTPRFPPRIELSASAFDSLMADARRDRDHPISVAAYTEGATPRFGVIVHNDALGLKWDYALDVSTAQLQQLTSRRIARGFQPLLVTGYSRLESSRYVAVWVDDRSQAPARGGPDPTEQKKPPERVREAGG